MKRIRAVANVALLAIGAAIVIGALGANQRWMDRHFLPSFFVPRRWYVLIENTVRSAIVVGGVALVLARRRIVNTLMQAPATALSIVFAVALALGVSEWMLHEARLRPTEWLSAEEEPRRQADERLGWVLAPGRTGFAVVGGRRIDYVIDGDGCRVDRDGAAVDRDRPTILFAGESVMFGEGLPWADTIPAQVERMLGVQSGNIAVHGYSTDQAYLRLQRELPRFQRPVAVVFLFMTALFGRNLDDDRPHLEPGLVWRPATRASKLASLATLLVPYRSEATVETGIRTTREVLHATVDLARARGATPLVIVPQLGQEDEAELALRRRLVTDDLPAVLVAVDGAWRLPWDRHPNARAAHEIAAAIADRLRRQG